ncbi:MAG: polyphosphate:AMP phosphotransferase [Defluviitaleaceae bacterium]|nr:polyphosphate:AMP phosphotransferase [Defluviitaleaceae bacterium]
MLSEVNTDVFMGKQEYKESIKLLENKLTDLQQKVIQAGLPVIIVFEGWGAAGKGTHISRLVNPLDPRHFDVRTTGKMNEEKKMRPFLWSYWTYLPPKGEIVIMDKSWHRLILPAVRNIWELTNMESHGFYFDVNAFERQLTDAGYLIIKLFLHISKDEQRRRFKTLEKDPTMAWRIKEHDWKQNENYAQHERQFEKLMKMTSTESNPWHVIESNDKRHATCKIMRTIIDSIEDRLNTPVVDVPPKIEITDKIPKLLQSVSPDETIDDAEYKDALNYYQDRMKMLTNKMFMKRRSAVIAFEGWDAAGKGGAIKRLTSEVDPRCYTVVPIAAPRPQELSRQYLWRFMVKMPKDGHLTIFDRSWFGRVLIERVDALTPEHIWRKAYREINEMEQHLVAHGTIILKFWMHIDKDEQLKRFESRRDDPLKQHKLTEDDWHNRSKWDDYVEAVNEMLLRTHTPHAPWIIVESNSKKFARIKVLQTVTDALDDALR